MLKLTPKEVGTLMEASLEVAKLYENLDQAKAHYLAEVERITQEINDAKDDARGIMEDAANAAEEYYDNKSEKWQEGDRGQAYSEWKERLRYIAESIAEDVEAPEVSDTEAPEWVSELGECEFSEFEF